MIQVENLIVEAVCHIQSKIDSENIIKSIDLIKGNLTQFMFNNGFYACDEPNFFRTRFLSMAFLRELPETESRISEKAKKNIGLISKKELGRKKFFKSLLNTRDDIPYKVSFCLVPKRLEETDGFVVTIRSEPVVLFKMRILNMRPKIDEFDLSDIVENNKHFINQIMIGNLARILKEPHALSECTFTLAVEKLDKFGFVRVAELLKQGQEKIEKGGTEDGLTDLREALAIFVEELVRKIGQKPTNKIGENLKTLEEQGYIDHWSCDAVHKFLYNWIYGYLSAKPVHGREKIKFDDAKFLYKIAEDIMSYLSEKVMLGR
jgi:hypothetical protein